MKKKISLNTIKVKSFITTLEAQKAQKIIGGNHSAEAVTCNATNDEKCTLDNLCDNNYTNHPCPKDTEDRGCLAETQYTCPVESKGAFCPV